MPSGTLPAGGNFFAFVLREDLEDNGTERIAKKLAQRRKGVFVFISAQPGDFVVSVLLIFFHRRVFSAVIIASEFSDLNFVFSLSYRFIAASSAIFEFVSPRTPSTTTYPFLCISFRISSALESSFRFGNANDHKISFPFSSPSSFFPSSSLLMMVTSTTSLQRKTFLPRAPARPLSTPPSPTVSPRASTMLSPANFFVEVQHSRHFVFVLREG